eukprot:jgi/Ulvmu1/2477/UM137_0002.1
MVVALSGRPLAGSPRRPALCSNGRLCVPKLPARKSVASRAEPSSAPTQDNALPLGLNTTILSKTVKFVKLQLPKLVGAFALAAVMMLSTPAMSEAASGGRMGGSGFSGARSGSSFGGSGSYGGARSYSAPRTSYGPTYSPTYTTPTIIQPRVVPSFGFGFGYPVVYGGGGGGGSLFTLLILGIFAYVAFNAISGSFGGGYDDAYADEDDPENDPMSVIKLQVGLLGSARELQRDLNRMGNTLDTSTPQGLHYLLQETVLSLRRNPQYAMYGKTELQKMRGLDNAESAFNRLSLEERGKFQNETLSNVGGRTTRNVAKVSGDGLNELIVVTVLAAVDGKVYPTDINSQDDLKSNLELLGSVPSDRLLALEVLWTPQDENDYFTKQELVTDYPTLNML